MACGGRNAGWGSASAGGGTVPKLRGTRERGSNGLVRRGAGGATRARVQPRLPVGAGGAVGAASAWTPCRSAGRGGRAARQACRHGPELCRRDARGHGAALSARAELFAQTRKHCRNALLQSFDKPLVHFEHLLQIGRRGIFHVVTRAGRAGHGELRCQSGSNIVGGNFVPMAGNGKQANRCRAPWLWARDGLSRSAHVGESRRASIHHDAARGYRNHSFECEHPFARANRICTKCNSNPLSTWSKHHLIV